ncbi:MAG: glycosyltransferase [Bacteroidia bacterium]
MIENDPTACQYISKEIVLEQSASSIKILVEAHATANADVRAFYAVNANPGKEPIFIPFPGYSNLNERGQVIDAKNNNGESDVFMTKSNRYAFESQNLDFKEYTFTVDDLPEFRTYRIKCFFNTGKLFYLEYNIRLLFYLMSQKAWALCAIDLDTLMPATLVSLIRKYKLVYDAHEYFTEVPEVVNRKRVKAIWEWVAKTCIPKAELCYTVGPKLADILGEKYQSKFGVIRNLPVTAHFESKKDIYESYPELDSGSISKEHHHNRRFILYQGALNQGRGLEALIEASKDLNVAVVLAGEGDLSQNLRAQASALKVQNVKFLGFVKPDDLKTITAKAWLGYNLLENKGLSYYYSLANKYFDYANAGVPCLNSKFPEYDALNQQFNCSREINLSAKAIVSEVEYLLNNQVEYEQLSRNSKKMADVLNWENEEKKLIELYEQL